MMASLPAGAQPKSSGFVYFGNQILSLKVMLIFYQGDDCCGHDWLSLPHMKIPFFQVDAFSARPFHGNPAAVCPLDEWLDDDTLQRIAEENNLSETAFFVRRTEGTYHLRWFTPLHEVDLCGHATLATAHVLYTSLGYGAKSVTFETRSGDLIVTRTPSGYEMDFPADYPEPVQLEGLDGILGAEVIHVCKGISDLLVEVANEAVIRNLSPDFRRMAALPFRGCIVTAPGSDTDIVSRCFYPAYGIDEDPVTGSAHTTLFSYWSRKWERNAFTAEQLSSQRGLVRGRVHGDRIILSGEAVLVIEGSIHLP